MSSLGNYHHNQDRSRFHHSHNLPCAAFLWSRPASALPTPWPSDLWQTLLSFSSLSSCCFKYVITLVIIDHEISWDWLLSLSRAPLRFVCVVACIHCSLWLVGSILWYEGHSLFVHLLKDSWIVFSWGILLINLLWTFIYRYLYEHRLLFLWINAPKCNSSNLTVNVHLIL